MGENSPPQQNGKTQLKMCHFGQNIDISEKIHRYLKAKKRVGRPKARAIVSRRIFAMLKCELRIETKVDVIPDSVLCPYLR